MQQRLAAGDGDHRRAALIDRGKTLFGSERFLRMCGGYCTLPHPAQARLQRKSGSSISTRG